MYTKVARSEERTRVLFPIVFSNHKENAPKGEMINISTRGACIITSSFFNKKDNIEFKIKIPEKYNNVLDIESLVKIRASVIWNKVQSRNFNSIKYGLKFIDRNLYTYKIKKIIQYENDLLSKKRWQCSHPETIFPTVPIYSEMLEGLKPSALSVDLTNKCNLNCKHCFWTSYERQLNQKTNPYILESVKRTLDRFKSITNVLWYGGEPLLNRQTRNLLKIGLKLKKNNTIITNGTYPLSEFSKDITLESNNHFGISIDGTEKMHNFLRGKNIYSTIKENIQEATKMNIPVAVLYCINAYNMDVIPEFLEEWANMNLLGIAFTLYTPISEKQSDLNPDTEQRYRMIDILLKMKNKYGDLIFNTEKMIELLDPVYNEELAQNCPMNVFNNKSRVYCFHLCNDGSIRIPCSLGREASHLECRSITKVALYAGKVLKDKKSFRTLLRMYLPGFHKRRMDLDN